ncbi:ATP-dependent DNA helicase [Caerostris darwini]|uniref:ATP-dependent DNA helicase n=1 Tax=Caerostris darwini TaxID=1538125 RepID=A0AAV4Q619_9ARAC|nr:ATP-dependent DNA helicase [Caerostris darwini]
MYNRQQKCTFDYVDYVDVEVFDIHDSKETETHQSTEKVAAASQMINSQQELTYHIIPLRTSVMAPIDVMQPNVEDEIQVSRNLNKITLKTKDNIVNVDHELKAEEFARSVLNELLAQIRTSSQFSSNDLNWSDQRKALLIADGRPDVDPSTLDIYETQQLIEKYPVILGRHLMVRVNALMKFIKNNDEVFGRKAKDHWWRIEFQNRGSPHLHIVVWIENHPKFDTEEGKLLLDRNCCCKMLTEEDPEFYELVKKCQNHRHTQICTKNNTSVRCQFNFPRQECDETRIVSHSSDDFLRNPGRIYLLKRRKEDAWVNNFHPQLLRLWAGNMNIQPCGSNEAIAYYIAKYLSIAEPEGVDSGIAQAIQ